MHYNQSHLLKNILEQKKYCFEMTATVFYIFLRAYVTVGLRKNTPSWFRRAACFSRYRCCKSSSGSEGVFRVADSVVEGPIQGRILCSLRWGARWWRPVEVSIGREKTEWWRRNTKVKRCKDIAFCSVTSAAFCLSFSLPNIVSFSFSLSLSFSLCVSLMLSVIFCQHSLRET